MLVYLLLLATISSIEALGLPDGVKPCKVDSSFNECALKQGPQAINSLVKGNPRYRIPVLDPMFIEKLQVSEAKNKHAQMNMTFENMNLYGLKDSTFLKSNWDFKNNKVEWSFSTPFLEHISDYTMKGKFLVVQLNGEGKSVISFENFNYSYIFEYRVVKRKGVEYADIVGTPVVRFTTTKTVYNLENIIKGDKLLSKGTNQVLNENWEAVNEATGPAITAAITQVFTQLLKNIIKFVPYSEMFAK